MDRIKLHEDICRKLNNMYIAKNSDYGNSFSRVRQEYYDAIIVHLMDKIERLKTLYKQGNSKVNESINDTLLDLANYAILELIERSVEHDKISERANRRNTRCCNVNRNNNKRVHRASNRNARARRIQQEISIRYVL